MNPVKETLYGMDQENIPKAGLVGRDCRCGSHADIGLPINQSIYVPSCQEVIMESPQP